MARATARGVEVICLQCGFAVGERVEMRSGLLPIDGGAPMLLTGVVVDGTEWGCCHFVLWNELSTATQLPNPHVYRPGPSN